MNGDDTGQTERRKSVDIHFCNERHRNITEWRKDMKNDMKAIAVKLNWFYLIAISTLAAVIYNIVQG